MVKARFKVGVGVNNQEVNDISIDCALKDFQLFQVELKKF